MVIALLFTALIAVANICLIPVFRLDAFEEYTRNVRFLIKLLCHKGYYPEQIKNTLNLYD